MELQVSRAELDGMMSDADMDVDDEAQDVDMQDAEGEEDKDGDSDDDGSPRDSIQDPHDPKSADPRPRPEATPPDTPSIATLVGGIES